MAFFSEKKCVQIHYSLKLKFFKKHFILNMDSEEGLVLVLLFINQKRRKTKKTKKTQYLGKTLAHARKCFSIFPLRLLFCPCIRATLRPINTFLPSKYKSSFRLVPAFCLWMPFYLFLSTLLLSCETEISHERIFFILNTIMQKIYDLPIRHQYISIISLNPKEKFFIKQ